MRIELEDGEFLTIATAHGVIVINPEPETGTLITAAANDEHKLAPKMDHTPEGKPLVRMWIQPAPSQNL